ncbi:hypothetical protein HDF17_001479 [Granulicella arctica]|uniref:BrnT family toxin n=2 Tax=Granulicella arctica TaxID=940613 RepID=A0A7Y9PFW6_9BACT|nr:hypothetical protein [Granulicella arctica]
MTFDKVTGFDWDDANRRKNEKHSVTQSEAEQVFMNVPLVVVEDDQHSMSEARFHALGLSDARRRLHVTFTLRHRGEKIRPISIRPMSRKERSIYEEFCKKTHAANS